jgi:hypothetical protein
MTVYIEDHLPVVKYNGLNTAKDVAISGTVTNTGAVTNSSTVLNSGAVTNSTTVATTGTTTVTGGVIPPGTAATVFHTGGTGATAAAAGTDTTPVVTETYYCEVFIPHNTTLTGLSVLNGTAVSGNIKVGLANSAGAVVASSASTTAGSGTNAYQSIAFSTTYAAVGPAKYFALVQYAATTARYRVHVVGNFGAGKVTSETYGTFTSGYATTVFATAGAIIADTY